VLSPVSSILFSRLRAGNGCRSHARTFHTYGVSVWLPTVCASSVSVRPVRSNVSPVGAACKADWARDTLLDEGVVSGAREMCTC
jgi:hypothetical protein